MAYTGYINDAFSLQIIQGLIKLYAIQQLQAYVTARKALSVFTVGSSGTFGQSGYTPGPLQSLIPNDAGYLVGTQGQNGAPDSPAIIGSIPITGAMVNAVIASAMDIVSRLEANDFAELNTLINLAGGLLS